jgi:hypothetical protein
VLLAFDWSGISGGVLAGLLAALIAWAVGRGLRRRRNRADFGSLSGGYQVAEKSTDEVAGTATLTGNGPSLHLSWVMEDGTVATGTIVMNEQSRVDGSGSYTHDTESGLGWGYLRVRVASRDPVVLRVDGTFTDQRARSEVASAWVWRRRTRLGVVFERNAPGP